MIEEATLLPYDLPLVRPWRTARGELHTRLGWLVRIRGHDGAVGWGDAAPLPEHGGESPQQCEQWLHGQLERLRGERAEQALETLRPGPPVARSALEGALLDLSARRAGRPLARLLDPAAGVQVAVNAAAGALDEQAPGQTAEAAAAGFTVIKLKVGLNPPAEGAGRLAALSGQYPDLRFRLDANGAWDLDAARAFIEAAGELPVECLEEPLRDPKVAALGLLQMEAPWPLAVDESLPRLGDAVIGAVRRLVLKPALLGGLRPSLALARRAQAAGSECVVTTALGSAAGGWLAAHLAAALDGGFPGLAHGLATGEWLAEDTGAPPRPVNGYLELPTAAGSGFAPSARFEEGRR